MHRIDAEAGGFNLLFEKKTKKKQASNLECANCAGSSSEIKTEYQYWILIWHRGVGAQGCLHKVLPAGYISPGISSHPFKFRVSVCK